MQSIQISFQANATEEADVVTDCGIRLYRLLQICGFGRMLVERRFIYVFIFNLGCVCCVEETVAAGLEEQ